MDHGEQHRRLMRAVNDRVRDIMGKHGVTEAEFLCECAIEDCTRTVRLPLELYDSLDGNRARLVAHGAHEKLSRV